MSTVSITFLRASYLTERRGLSHFIPKPNHCILTVLPGDFEQTRIRRFKARSTYVERVQWAGKTTTPLPDQPSIFWYGGQPIPRPSSPPLHPLQQQSAVNVQTTNLDPRAQHLANNTPHPYWANPPPVKYWTNSPTSPPTPPLVSGPLLLPGASLGPGPPFLRGQPHSPVPFPPGQLFPPVPIQRRQPHPPAPPTLPARPRQRAKTSGRNTPADDAATRGSGEKPTSSQQPLQFANTSLSDFGHAFQQSFAQAQQELDEQVRGRKRRRNVEVVVEMQAVGVGPSRPSQQVGGGGPISTFLTDSDTMQTRRLQGRSDFDIDAEMAKESAMGGNAS